MNVDISLNSQPLVYRLGDVDMPSTPKPSIVPTPLKINVPVNDMTISNIEAILEQLLKEQKQKRRQPSASKKQIASQ